MRAFRTCSRRFAPVVLAGYVLAVSAAGLFHRHGDECCDSGQCQAVANTSSTADSHAGCRHHHHHAPQEGTAPQHACPEHGKPATQTAERGKGHGPASPASPHSHDGCAVCQFLAEQSEAPVLISFEIWSPLSAETAVAAADFAPAPAFCEHPARGPPPAARPA